MCTPSGCWRLDEVFIRIGGKIQYLWRAVDDEGELLDVILQPRRDRNAARKLLGRLLKRQGYLPDAIVTDRLRSYGAALRDLGLAERHLTGGRSNNRVEVLHLGTADQPSKPPSTPAVCRAFHRLDRGGDRPDPPQIRPPRGPPATKITAITITAINPSLATAYGKNALPWFFSW